MKAFSTHQDNINSFLPRLFLSYQTIPHAGRLQSLSASTGRQIRALLTMSYSTNEKMWYKKNEESTPEKVKFLMQTGQNMAWVSGNQKGVIGHAD